MLSLFEAIEFKNPSDQEFINNLLAPKIPRMLPAKIVYQKFKNGQAVFTLITRD
jgi:hypothetical protein